MWPAPPGELEDREWYYPPKDEGDLAEEKALRTVEPRVVYDIPEEFWAGDEIHTSSAFRFLLSAVLVFTFALVIFLLIYLLLIFLDLHPDPWIMAVLFVISGILAIPVAYVAAPLKATIETVMSAGTLIEYADSPEEMEGEILDVFAENTKFGRVSEVKCNGDCRAYEDPDGGVVLKMFRYTRPRDGRKFIIVVVSLKRNGDEEVYRRVKHGISEKWNKREYTAILQV